MKWFILSHAIGETHEDYEKLLNTLLRIRRGNAITGWKLGERALNEKWKRIDSSLQWTDSA